MKARTLEEIFRTDYQPYSAKMRWRDYKMAYLWKPSIELAFKHGWHLHPTCVRAKRPLKGYHWGDKPPLTQEEAVWWTQKDFNLMVVAGPSKLFLLDLDNTLTIPRRLRNLTDATLTMRTAGGFQWIVESTNPSKLLKHSDQLHRLFSEIRQDIMYSLIPCSTTCVYEKGRPKGGSACRANDPEHPHPSSIINGATVLRHDYRIREWLDSSKPIIPFMDMVKLIL